jgi:hypothetical protein
MIITKQKEIREILDSVGKGPVFILGCNECATLCHTGGEKELIEMKDILKENNIQVSGWAVLEPACHLNNDRFLLKNHINALEKSNIILVLACGNGVQTISELFEDKDVISGNDTLFLGEILRVNEFVKRCNMCGDCILDSFDGFCPVSRCPKSMLNGPCGGAIDRKCEVKMELDCIWTIIYERLKMRDQLHLLEDIKKPKDWSKSLEMTMRL